MVQDMKPDLRKGQIGAALSIGIDDLTKLLQQGPPSFLDRLDDFVERFGVVIAFTLFTFVFATWGECRDRRNRFFSAERMSRMSKSEKEKARRLQMQFKTKAVSSTLQFNALHPVIYLIYTFFFHSSALFVLNHSRQTNNWTMKSLLQQSKRKL